MIPARKTAGTRKRAAPGALAGLRVLDLTIVVVGAYATQILGDHGAETRYPGLSRHRGMRAIFLKTNRNKRSIALDLRYPLGREALPNRLRGRSATPKGEQTDVPWAIGRVPAHGELSSL
jgi:crotonobetainyl-CoA:carnitine CoA-transferase CaiB-like acyl-CoA transferase